jgi:hypothetical protein
MISWGDPNPCNRPSYLQERCLVTHEKSMVWHMRTQQDAIPLPSQGESEVQNARLVAVIEVRREVVDDEDAGPLRQRAGDQYHLDHLALTAAELRKPCLSQ